MRQIVLPTPMLILPGECAQGLAIKPQLATGSQKALAAPSGSASGSKSNADAAKTRTTTAAGQPLNAVQVELLNFSLSNLKPLRMV